MQKLHVSLASRRLGLFAILTVSVALIFTAANSFRSSAEGQHPRAPLTFAQRVEFERAIQGVYQRHRIFANQQQPTLAESVPVELISAKVENNLRQADALAEMWQVEITPTMLQAEIERMSEETRQPKVLRELWSALERDAYLVAECLARPILVERMIKAQADKFEARKENFGEWWASNKTKFSVEVKNQDFTYRLPEIGSGSDFAADTWKPLPTLPDGSTEHTIVWTGTEALVWGGVIPGSGATKTSAGSRYNPATDSWSPITGSGAPSPRRAHTAVWTGTEMIVWGGCGQSTHFCGSGSGGRYNPATDSWLPTSATDAPNPRLDHTAVWTGDRMIIFGGCNPNSNFSNCPSRNDGGMYFPATDTWVATSLTNAPTIRRDHTAVWTGAEMLIWGGLSNIGGRFDPNTNSWTTMNAANAPESRERHTAVWTGTEMIVWGGSVTSYIKLNTGGRYNPTSDSWTPTNTANAPEARYLHTGIWTGTEMIIWGGNTATLGENFLNTGAKYNPATDTWTPTNTGFAPLPREQHKAIWTGSEMILWGGRRDVSGKTGSRYNPATDSWTVISANESATNTDAETVWTGAEMIIWGGSNINRGMKYNPATSAWSPIANATGLEQRDRGFKLIWTGTEMIVWGGQTGNWVLDTGGRYNPATDTWTLTAMANAPVERAYHTAVWTGNEMIIWGGSNGVLLNDGGRYNPSTNSWSPVSITGAPQARYLHTAVFVGGKMVVWSGSGGSGFLNTGGRYEPSANSWQPVSTVNAPEPRMNHTAISTGTEMIVWGGHQFQLGAPFFNSGGRYNPTTDVWVPTSLTEAPSPRAFHTSVWTGTEMIVWGGNITDSFVGSNTGGRYNPATNSWQATSIFRAGTERSDHVAVWTGENMIIWGGNVRAGSARAGYEYIVSANAPAMFDFDGDGKTDVSVFRPSDGTWYLLRSNLGFSATQFGLSSDEVAPADYDGDGKTDIAVFRDGMWYALRSTQGFTAGSFGQAGDLPMPGDYDGDGKADISVYRPAAGTFYLLHSSDNSFHLQQWGQSGDLPTMGDYDGDNKTDFAVFRPSLGAFYILRSSDGVWTGQQFGQSGDNPIAADFDGDGKTDLAVYRPSAGRWYYQQSSDNSFREIAWGTNGDVPSAGHYDGDAKCDVAVFRPSTGTFYILQSTNGAMRSEQFGANGDVPVPAAYVY